MNEAKFKCHGCGKTVSFQTEDYTYAKDDEGNTYCYTCGAILDMKSMNEMGKATLFLVEEHPVVDSAGFDFSKQYHVVNWNHTLKFKVYSVSLSIHNFGLLRTDVWFVFNGHVWHGYSIGDNTQLCHCKRTKKKAPMKVVVRKDASDNYIRSRSFPINHKYTDMLKAIEGRTIPVETKHIFKDQFNTPPIDGVSKCGLRLMNRDIESIINDIRPFKTKCDYCGRVFDKDFICPECESNTHIEQFNSLWKGVCQ
jgi:Zn finger protein HypA/HybF involved in hydrogenase expression